MKRTTHHTTAKRMGWALVLLAACCPGCDEKIDAVQLVDAGCADPGTVTYSSAIKGLVTRHCIDCHSASSSGTDRKGAPSYENFDTYAEVKASASSANSRIQSGSMPPSSFNNPLTECEKKIFAAWVAQGAKEK